MLLSEVLSILVVCYFVDCNSMRSSREEPKGAFLLQGEHLVRLVDGPWDISIRVLEVREVRSSPDHIRNAMSLTIHPPRDLAGLSSEFFLG